MTLESFDRIVRSTLQIVMCTPLTYEPKGIGSGCIVLYDEKLILLTVAHLTDNQYIELIDKGLDPVNDRNEMFHPGAMQYLYSFDVSRLEDQVNNVNEVYEHPEEKQFGQIDVSMALIKNRLELYQREYRFRDYIINNGTKSYIPSSFLDEPSCEATYGFFGHRKGEYFQGPVGRKYFETQPFFCGGIRFVRQINNHYEFELTKEIQDHLDFKGTSGAPILDASGNLVSLVTQGNLNSKKIFGLALRNLKSAVDAFLFNESTGIKK